MPILCCPHTILPGCAYVKTWGGRMLLPHFPFNKDEGTGRYDLCSNLGVSAIWTSMDYFSVEAAGRVEVHKCWGQIAVPLPVCKCCLRQLSSQPVLSLSAPRDHSVVLSWGFPKLSASDVTLKLSDAAAQPRLPEHFEHIIQTDKSRQSN